ncbi:HAD family hydrolase [Thermodesulfobacteriota bacterium]
MSCKAILFDLDGTLLDTLEDIGDAANRALIDNGFPPHPPDAYRYFVGDGIVKLMTRALPEGARDEGTIAVCLEALREAYRANWNVKTRPYAGIPEMLDAVMERGLKMAVLSNKPQEFTKLCVDELLVQWRFAPVFGKRDGVPRKPDPAGAMEIVHQLGVEPAEFLYLGDTAIDMKTACAAGMFPVGACWGFRPAEELLEGGARVLVEHPMEIPRHLDSV